MAEEQPKKPRVDYTQVRAIGDDQSEKTAKLVRDLERRINQCKREFDLWFYGTNPKPPYEMRSQLDGYVRVLRNKLPKRTADAFRIGVVLVRYQTLVEHWDKSMRKEEEGGRALWMAASHQSPLDALREANEQRQEEASKPSKPNRSTYLARIKSPEADEDGMRKIFNSYVAAKKKCGEAVDPASFDKFRKTLGKQTKGLIDSGKASAVAYRVEIRDGKVSIKARAEK